MIDFARLTRDFDSLQERFRSAKPFPHLVLDGLFDGRELASAIADWPSPDNGGWRHYQKGKRAFASPGLAKPWAGQLMRSCNHRKFVDWLAALTGITDLSADYELNGGGLHEVVSGGSLGIHVEFNRLGSLYRRMNALLFLNRDWSPEWGGQLELRRNARETEDRVVIEPEFNRLVVFETSEHSWHGHPEPLRCPDGVTRKSVAFYYYSRDPHPSYLGDHSTVYVKGDKCD